MHTHSPRAARHLALGSTCLLALPAALALSNAALAQTVITTDQTGTLNLAAYGAGGVAVAQGVSITGTGAAAVSSGSAAQFSNAGNVADMNGNGIDLAAGGSVANSGSVTASGYGVRTSGAAAQVSNSGAIGAGYDGISLNKGGSVTNTGSVFGGHIGVYTGNGLGDVTNSGDITARSGDAVSLYGGGRLTNTASGNLSGGYAGAYAKGDGAVITNAGHVTGGQFGVYLMGASVVNNTGVIAGGTDGVKDLNPGGQVVNAGLIHGGQVGIQLAGHGSVQNSGNVSGGAIGVKLGTNGTLANDASGRISGGTAGVQAAAGDALQNAGAIAGATGIVATGAVSITDTGSITAAQTGGNAISLAGGASTVTLDTGAVIDGNIAGNGTASQVVLEGSGALSADLIGFGAGSAVTVQSGAVWTGSGNWQVAQLVNNGTFTPGVMGVPLSLTGDFVQGAAGTLRVLVTPDGISPFAITGHATLGGTLHYVLAPGTYQPGAHTFLTAAGGISGEFASVTGTQNGISETPMQPTQAPAASPAAAATASAPAAAALSLSAPATVAPGDAALFANATQAMAMGALSAGQTVLDQAASATGSWIKATGAFGSVNGAYHVSGGGFLAGLDHGNGLGGRVGVAVGLDSAVMSDAAGSSARLQTVRLGLYAVQPAGAFVLSADVMGGIVSSNTTRYTGAAGAVAQGTGHTISGDFQIARPFIFHGANIVPAAGIAIASVTTGALNETSATQAFAVKVAGAHGTAVVPYLRLSMDKTYVTDSNIAITPSLSLGLNAMANNPGAATTLTTEDGTRFTANPTHLAPVSGQIGAGISISRGNWSITASYSANVGGNWSGQNLQAGVQVRF